MANGTGERDGGYVESKRLQGLFLSLRGFLLFFEGVWHSLLLVDGHGES